MRFFSSGPDIPERLLRAHEDGCVAYVVVNNYVELMEVVGKEAAPHHPEPPRCTSHHISACEANRVYQNNISGRGSEVPWKL